MAKLPFMMGRYKWLVKVLSVGAECKGEDPNAGHKETTSTKQHNTTVDNGSLTKKCFDKKVVNNISKKPRFHIEEHKVFNDPIHGHMALHPVLVKIIDTPEFQRLRNIKQLGGIYFVYPGASHNRFEHSIGVAHLAGELAKALKMKQEKEIEQLEDSKKLTLLMESTSEELEKLKLHMLKTEDLEMLENFKKLEKFDDKELEEFKKCKPVEFIKFEKMNQLKKFGPEDLKKLNESKESLISDQDVLCVQIAGLCHDLGHGPFSHFFDGMFMDAIKTDEKGEADNEEWTHEEASIEMFNHLLVQNGLKEEMAKYGLKVDGNDETDLLFIKEMINGPLNPAQDKKPQNDAAQDNGPQNNDASKKWPYKGRDEKKSFLYEIVSNKKTGIDVDKFDYLARDCQQLGIPNSFDHQRFIMFARVCDVKEDGRKHICPRDKESANLYDIFQQRVSIHRKACQHKIKMAVEIMIKDALILADKDPEITIKGSGDEMLSISKAKGDMVAYTKLTDQVIETVLNSSSDSLKEAREILQRVMTRDLYRCVGQAKKKSEKNVFSYVLTWFKELLKYIQVDGKDRDEVTDKKKEKKKQFKKTKKDLEEKLSERFPGDKFEIIDATLDYGMENVDPISKAFSYSKDNPDEGKRIVKSEVFSVLPDWFSDEILRVYWKNPKGLNDEEIKKREVKFKEFFKGWCKRNSYKDLQG